MPSHYITFDYFSKHMLDPMFELFDVLDNKNHPENKNLYNDLKSIDKNELEAFVKINPIDFLIDRFKNKDIGRRAYYLINKLQQDIARVRIEKLLDINDRPAPYNLKNLRNIHLDKNFLVPIDSFKIDNEGFEKDGFVYTLCPILNRSNSSHWIFRTILKLSKEKGINFKIRLDPFKEILVKDYFLMSYKMFVYGKSLDWQKLIKLRNDEHGKWTNESNTVITDYVWSPKDNEIHFTCEELPNLDNKEIKSSRYFHAIFDKKTGGINHCDGAIRIYSDYELNNRIKYHVKDSNVRKAGKRIKIFQFESNCNGIDQDMFCQLVTSFFVWNDDIQKYFNL